MAPYVLRNVKRADSDACRHITSRFSDRPDSDARSVGDNPTWRGIRFLIENERKSASTSMDLDSRGCAHSYGDCAGDASDHVQFLHRF